MNKKERITLSIASCLVPVLLAYSLYNAVDCNHLTDKNYAAWIAQGNKGSFDMMKVACNSIHGIILVTMIPLSPILFYTTFRMTELPEKEKDSVS